MKFILVLSVVLACLALSRAATIRWTNAGGNPLWEEPRNWDAGRVPAAGDDAIIDIQNIPGSVVISAVPANVRTLTIGGTSGTAQTLRVQGALTLNSGGSIMSNGNLILQSSNDLPFTTYGTFNAADKLLFISGSLSGPGQFLFTNISFSGSAEKQINGTVNIATLSIEPGVGATGVVTIASGSLTVTGTLKTTQSLILTSSTGAQLNVPGTFSFAAGSSAYTAAISGLATINTLTVGSGTFILNDNVNVASATIGQGSILLTGGAKSTRVFGDISGQGVLQIQGGINQFSSISNLGTITLSGGSVVLTDQAASVVTLTQTGGTISGPASLSVQNLKLVNSLLQSVPVKVATLTFQGFATLTDSSLLVSNNAVISALSQISFAGSSSFVIASSASVSQTASFKILPADSGVASQFTLNGMWTSTSDLQIVVATTGTGTFQLQSGSTTTLTGIKFSVGSFVLSSSTLTSLGATVSVGTVSGTGTIETQGQQFTVTQSLNAAKFTQTTGSSSVASGSITTLDLQGGVFTITGPAPPVGASLSLGTFSFEGGSIMGSSMLSLSASVINITGTQPHTFSSLVVTAPKLTSNCGAQQCQIFTQNVEMNIGQ